jgi:hypothetical protein
MEKKICSSCSIEKEIIEFGKDKNKKDGLKNVCKDCRKIESKNRYLENREYFTNYRETNRDEILLKLKIWRENNPEKRKEYYQKNIDKEKNYSIEYRKNNKEYYRIYQNIRYSNDDLYKLRKLITSRISKKINKINEDNTQKTIEILGCSISFLKTFIETQFKDGMSWENHGLFGWHIDHKIPLSSAKNSLELEKLCHYTNLQPLWAEENISKRDKIV